MLNFSKDKKIKGEIGYFKLEDWWLNNFNEQQREYITDTYQPMGGSSRSLVEGNIDWSSATVGSFLSNLGSWFMGPKDRDLGRIIFDKALELSENSNDPLDKHFTLQGLIQIYYRDRDKDDFYAKAIEYCKRQIKMQSQASAKFKQEYPNQALPAHVGYEQYSIVLEKEKKYSEVISLSEEANRNGWAGSWKERIERCKKKLAKAKS